MGLSGQKALPMYSRAGPLWFFWWRRGRVELPVQKGFRFDFYECSRRYLSHRHAHPIGLASVATS